MKEKGRSGILGIILLLFSSCQNQDQSSNTLADKPYFIESSGYIVPKDSITPPRITPVDENKLKRYPLPPAENIHLTIHTSFPANPKKINAGQPTITTPGAGGYAYPDSVESVENPFYAHSPQITIAKEPKSKDHNPGSFLFYGNQQGLSTNQVRALMEDHFGNLWFSNRHGGMTRFDGRFFTNYSTNSGLPHNDVMCILEDHQGQIWIGTNGAGLAKFDGSRFTYFNTLESILCPSIYSLYEDSKKNIWIGTWSNGLSKYDGKSFTHYTTKSGFPKDIGLSILEDYNGDYWFGTESNGVVRYDGKQIYQYSTEQGLSGNEVVQLFEDHDGNIWMGTRGHGVTMFDGKTFYQYTKEQGLPGNNINCFMEDKEGRLWIATNGGTAILHNDSLSIINTDDGLPSNDTYSLLTDQFGQIWMGTISGLVQYTPELFRHYTKSEGLPQEKIATLYSDQNKNILMGATGTIIQYDGTHFLNRPLPSVFKDFPVMVIRSQHNGDLWAIMQDQGIIRVHQNAITHFTREDGLLSQGATTLYADQNGEVWTGFNGAGLSKYDGHNWTQYAGTSYGLSDPDILDIVRDHRGLMWLATYGGGLTVFRDNQFVHFTPKQGFISENVMCLLENEDGSMWIGTYDKGLCLCQLEENNMHLRCINLTTANGLPDNEVKMLMVDRNKNLVLNTKSGFSILPRSKRGTLESISFRDSSLMLHSLFVNYSYKDGLVGEYSLNHYSMAEDKKGTLWLACGDRLTSFSPSGLIQRTDTTGPVLLMSGLELFNEQINWTDFIGHENKTIVLNNGIHAGPFQFSGLIRYQNVPENLSLRYSDNYLTFNFIGISLQPSQDLQYQYRLEGNDDHWSSLSDETEAHYGNLDHGTYTFRVKAQNSEGVWSRELSFPFIITPPWWQTPWAYIGYFLSFSALLWWISRIVKERAIRKEKERSTQVELSQAREIERAYTELKSTQAQLIQSEKMASLGQVTAGIAHEIQNPLNFVNNFSDVNKELLSEMKEEMGKGHIDEATTIADDIIANEEKINHHGKRADAIVKSMLQHSRTSTGQKEPTDINALADEYLRLAYHGLRAKDKSFNATMKTEYDQSIGLVNVIPQDIGRAILNLITNAFYVVSTPKSPKGDLPYVPTVTVKTNLIKSPSGDLGAKRSIGDLETKQVEISVTDNGLGIPASILDKIFQPFFTTKPTGQGTGLGLSLSYDIVKAHGGELIVETKEGEGSTFSIQLPIGNP